MGLCDPKAVRSGKAWYQQVNEPGFITQEMKDLHAQRHGIVRGVVIGRIQSPSLVGHNKSSVNDNERTT
jgi:hypothetical protein